MDLGRHVGIGDATSGLLIFVLCLLLAVVLELGERLLARSSKARYLFQLVFVAAVLLAANATCAAVA